MKILSKLRKIAESVKKEDIKVTSTGRMIEVEIINDSKKISKDDSDVGTLTFYTGEKPHSGIAYIYVEWFGVDEAYRGSIIARTILTRFERDVVNPLIAKHGRDKVEIAADFANEELMEVIQKYCERKELHFNDICVNEITHAELFEKMNELGLESIYGEEDEYHVKNESIDKFLNIAEMSAKELYMDLHSFNFNEPVNGKIDSNGDIFMTLCDSYNDLEFIQGIRFFYYGDDSAIEITEGSLKDFNNINIDNFSKNFTTVFKDASSYDFEVRFNDSGDDFTLEELLEELSNESTEKQSKNTSRLNKRS